MQRIVQRALQSNRYVGVAIYVDQHHTKFVAGLGVVGIKGSITMNSNAPKDLPESGKFRLADGNPRMRWMTNWSLVALKSVMTSLTLASGVAGESRRAENWIERDPDRATRNAPS